MGGVVLSRKPAISLKGAKINEIGAKINDLGWPWRAITLSVKHVGEGKAGHRGSEMGPLRPLATSYRLPVVTINLSFLQCSETAGKTDQQTDTPMTGGRLRASHRLPKSMQIYQVLRTSYHTLSLTVRVCAPSNNLLRRIYSVYHFHHITKPYFMTV